jgi:D-alanyl-D-alanine dipeptidase
MQDNFIMPQSQYHLTQLVDVVALSQKKCSRPIQALLAYATPENFIGRVIDGYTPGLTNFALLTKNAAEALCAVQNTLLTNHNLGLLIYDSYRPKRAVRDFVKWSSAPVNDDAAGRFELQRKAVHYPNIEKARMFELGYVAEDSQHCYGHTVDLVLIDENGVELDLAACFDFMDVLSHSTATAADIGDEAFKNRTILAETMKSHGFMSYPNEFWHYNFNEKTINEPIDIFITPDLQGLNVA